MARMEKKLLSKKRRSHVIPAAPCRTAVPQRDTQGVALIIVLAFVVLLTGLVIAYFSRSMADRQLSNSSFNQAKVDELANGALAIITSDLKQEIVNGSTVAPTSNTNYPVVYLSNSNAYMVPVRSSNVPAKWSLSGYANTTLLRMSGTGALAFPGVDQPASNALSTGTSANGRSISMARWNQHYLLPLATPTAPTNTTPDTAAAGSVFTAPAWVYVTGTGGASSTLALTGPNNSVVGRYAYAIYDEGALLDANVAGFPIDTTGAAMPPQYVSKGSIAFADLTPLGAGARVPKQAGINSLVGWRNYASMLTLSGSVPSGTFPNFTFTGTASVANSYKTLILSNTNRFATVGNAVSNGVTDQAFLSRQELINLIQTIGTTNFNPNSLQYLGTFSRAVTAPSWRPTATLGTPVGNTIDYANKAETSGTVNRDLANVRFLNSGTCTHWSDGVMTSSGSMTAAPTSATYNVNAGDPLLQSRFSLAKIAWLSQADPNAGTAPSSAYTQAIQTCFGLSWGVVGAANGGNACWTYVGPTGSTAQGTIETLDQVAAETPPREPNFFELLKAAILNGSIGINPGPAAFANGTNIASTDYHGTGYPAGDYGCDGLYAYSFDRTVAGNVPAPARISDLQIIQIGADIIDEFDADSYPTAIYFKYPGMTAQFDAATANNGIFGSSDMVFGEENLPELQGMAIITATVDGLPNGNGASWSGSSGVNPTAQGPTAGFADWWQPALWNPHQPPNPSNSTVAPPTTFQIQGYGKAHFVWGSSSSSAVPSSGAAPVQTFDGVQFINFTDTAPATLPVGSGTSAFYDAPLLLTQNTIPNVTASTSLPAMSANSSMFNYALNPFVGFWAGSDPTYTGSQGFVNVSAEGGSVDSFTLGWTDSHGGFHPYSFITGMFSYTYGVVNNHFILPQGGCTPADSAAEDHVNVEPRTLRFSTTCNWEFGDTTNSTTLGFLTMPSYFPYKSSHGNDTYGWGQPAATNFTMTWPNIYGATIEDWQVNQASPIANTTALPTYYSDPDGVVRPADGAFGNATTGDGMLTYQGLCYGVNVDYTNRPAHNTTSLRGSGTGAPTGAGPFAVGDKGGNVQHGRRPVILNRPFRSVGELGYVFRGEPFKSLDFFSTSSADAALLDVFSVADQARVSNGQLNSVVAGQVNLDNAPYQVIQALLSGEAKKDSDPNYTLLSTTGALSVAKGIQQTLSGTGGIGTPLNSRADLVTLLGAVPSTGQGPIASALAGSTTPGDASNKNYLEGPVRGLADVANTRTWNLMVDVIAQTGVFPPNVSANAGLNSSFYVQGERRYWLHIAIDRYTGKVIDQQLEPVYE